MKITLIVTARVTAETFVQGFAQFIASNGYEVTVIADGVEPSFEQTGKGWIRFLPVAMKRNPSPIDDIRSLITLTLTLNQLKPDVVLYATPKASLLGSIAATVNRIPTRIYQLWGLRLETVHGPGRTLLSALELLTSCLSSSILANSQSLAYRYRKLHLNAFTEVHVVAQGSSHGVDLDYFTPTVLENEPNLPDRKNYEQKINSLTLGFVGRLHPDKGIDTLINAIEILINRGLPVSAIIVGNNEGFAHPMSDKVKAAIDFVGFTTDTRQFYRKMDVLVLPSLREGFPNVVLEAAAMGIPAIVSDATGVRDSVVDGTTGYIFPVGNYSALAKKIETFLLDRDSISEMGTAARERAEKYFSQEYVWTETLDFITRKIQ